MKKIEQRIEKLESATGNQNIAVLFEPRDDASQGEHAAHKLQVEQAKLDGGHVIVVSFQGAMAQKSEPGITHMGMTEAYRFMCEQKVTTLKGPAMNPADAYQMMNLD